MIRTRLLPFLRILRAPERRYSTLAYLGGMLLPGRRVGRQALACVRGWPLPELSADGGCIELGHIGLHPGVKLQCGPTGRIRVGDGSFLNRQVRIFADAEVWIGRECMVSWDTLISTRTGVGRTAQSAAVVIEDGVWIGCRAIVLGGTRLGRGCVVAAGSVVQGEFPAGVVLAGRAAEPVAHA